MESQLDLQVNEAKSAMPALLVLDDIDILCPSAGMESAELPQDASESSLVSWLCSLFDSLRPAGRLPLPGTHAMTNAGTADHHP